MQLKRVTHHPPSARPATTRWRVRTCCGGLLVCACGTGAPFTAAADPPHTEQAPGGTVTPPTLKAQVALRYPSEALPEGLHGDVVVRVRVSPTGEVEQVEVLKGPEVFHASALEAARRMEFVPAQRDGTPVVGTTRVRFHFAPPEIRELAESLEEVVVHATHPDLEDVRARTTLDEEALARRAGLDLAQTVQGVPGVRTAGGTGDAAKPIIRGQQERRLLVLYDGVRHESQKWGPDHATEIDPFAAGSISVIRGAAGARYGPDAIGGVILVEPPALRAEPGVGGKVQATYATNGRRPSGAFRLDAVPAGADRWTLRVEGNAARGASRRAPRYVLGNTATALWNLGATAQYRWRSGHVKASWHRHDFRAGLFYGVRVSTPADFAAQLDAERPATADLWSTSYTIDRAFQDVSHDIGVLEVVTGGSWGTLESTYAFQLNRRQEYEQIREQVTGPQYDFTLRTHSVDSLYRHPRISAMGGSLEGGLGLQGMFQENVYRGFSLIPNHRTFAGGVFGFERLSLAAVDLEAGARFDALSRTAFLTEDDFGRHVRRGTLDDEVCEPLASSVRCPNAYDTGSVSLGALVHVWPGHAELKLDLSSASRFPDVDELFLVGTAPSFPVFAVGSPDLGVETSWGGSATGGLRVGFLRAELSAYGNLVHNYIYFAPELNAAGEPRFDVTIRGTWPRFLYRPVDALVYGADGSIELGAQAPIGLDVRGALVRARERTSGEHLIGTPPDHLHLALVARPPALGALRDLELGLTADLVARQSRTDLDADFAPPPDGYALLGLAADATLQLGGTSLRVGAQVVNLLNTSYREYTSLLRYYADQPGRDVRVRIGTDF